VSNGGDDYYQASLPGLQNPLTIADADGTTYTFGVSGNHDDRDSHYSQIVSSIEDRNGNVITLTDLGAQHAGSFTATDTLGRTMLSTSGFGSNGDTVTVSGFGNPYTVGWSTIATGPPVAVGATLLYNGNGQCITTFPNISGGGVSAIKSITLPNNTSYTYTFSYDTSYGLVNQITYPNGGYVKYVWGLNPLSEFDSIEDTTGGPNNCLWEHDTPAVMHRYVSFDGVNTALQQDFSYSTTWSATTGVWSSKTTTVTTTDKVTGLVDTKTYTYSAITPPSQPNDFNRYAQQIPVEQTIVVKDSTNKTLRTTTKAWLDQYELASEQTTLEDNSTTSKTTYSYGPGAQVTGKDDYDWSTGTPPLLRRTTTSYQSFAATPIFTAAASIVDRPCQTIVSDGSGKRYAETDYFYDNGGTGTVCSTAGTPSVTGVTNLTGHDETNYGATSSSPRGNATTVVRQCFQGTTACAIGNPTTIYTYDETGQVLSVKDPKGNTTGYSFVDGYVSTNTGSFTTTGGAPPSGKVTNAYLTKITYPQTGSTNHIETFTYGYNDGELTTATDENGQVTGKMTTYRYNDNFDRPTETDYPDGGQTTLSYTDTGTSPSVTSTKLISTSPSVNLTSATVMDGMGRVVQAQLTTDPDGTTFTAKTYDGHSRAYQSYNPTRCSPPTTNCGKETTWGLTTYTYDALGRTTNVADPDGSAATTKYSLNQATVTDEVGNQRTSTTDALGRLTAVAEAPTVSGYNWQTTYVNDPLNDLTSVTQNGSDSAKARVRTFGYDSVAHLLSATNPESGQITYTYDLNGNVVTKVEPEANQTGGAQTINTYAYDALNRVLSRSDTSPANADTLYQYDGVTLTGCGGPVPPGISGATNLIGSRSSMCSGFSASSFSYDSMGRLLTEAKKNQGSSAITHSVGYTYYLDGSLKTLTYPSGDVVTYTVGGAERVTAVSDSASNYVGYSGTPTSPTTYAPQGALATMTQGQTSSFAGLTSSNTYNDRLQPILLSAGISGGSSILSLCYDFHLHQTVSSGSCSFSSYSTGDNGNVFQVLNNNDSTRSAAYIYDPLNRIAQAYTLNETSTNCWGETYSLTATAPGVLPTPSNLGIDAWGNLTNRSGPSGMGSCKTEPLSSTASTKNQLSILTYDAAGDVTKDGNGNQPTYDAMKELYTDAGFNYRYDADGARIYKSSGSSGTLYWPGPSGNLTETDLTGTINDEYIYFNGERIARVDRPSGTVHYYFSDHLGSASAISDATGKNPTYYYYYPYGGLVATVGSDPNNYKFTGKERDSESGLDEFGARYYGSSLGRFMTPDWAAKPTTVPYANFGDPQSLNLYAYVDNAPPIRVDAVGHASEDAVPGGGISPPLYSSGGWQDQAAQEQTLELHLAAFQKTVAVAQNQSQTQNQSNQQSNAPANSRTDVLLYGREYTPTPGREYAASWTMDWYAGSCSGDKCSQSAANKQQTISLVESLNGSAFKPTGDPSKGVAHDQISPEAKTFNQHWFVDNKQVQLVVGKDSKGNLIKTWEVHVVINKLGDRPTYSPVP